MGVGLIEDNIREHRLRWFEHVCHRSADAIVRSDMVIVEGNTKGAADQNCFERR